MSTHQTSQLSTPHYATKVTMAFGMTIAMVVALGVAQTASAEEHQLVLDPETTEILFHLEATGHDVEGHFYLESGTVTFDPEAGTAGGEIRIDATRAESGNEKRDKTMHRKVLESESHPLIVFVPESFEGTFSTSGTSQLDLIGTMTLLGENHPMTLSTTAEVTGTEVVATSTFIVPYIDWGLKNPSLLILRVAKEVEVTVQAKGTLGSTTGSPAEAGR